MSSHLKMHLYKCGVGRELDLTKVGDLLARTLEDNMWEGIELMHGRDGNDDQGHPSRIGGEHGRRGEKSANLAGSIGCTLWKRWKNC